MAGTLCGGLSSISGASVCFGSGAASFRLESLGDGRCALLRPDGARIAAGRIEEVLQAAERMAPDACVPDEAIFSLLVAAGDRKGLESLNGRLCPELLLEFEDNAIWLRTAAGAVFSRRREGGGQGDIPPVTLAGTVREAEKVALGRAAALLCAWRGQKTARVREILAKGEAGAVGLPGPQSASGAQRELARLLMAFGAELSRGRRSGRNALHEAAETCSGEIADFLLDLGFEPDADADGWTPLLLAARSGNGGAFGVLARALAARADLSVRECLAAEILRLEDAARQLRRAALRFPARR